MATVKANKTLLVWIRQELRIHDNPVLWFRPQEFSHVIPVYIFDPRAFATTHDFGLSRHSHHRGRFLLESVNDFKTKLQTLGSDLVVRQGLPADVLSRLAQECDVTDAVWAYHVGTEEEREAKQVADTLRSKGVNVHAERWDATLLHINDLPFDNVKRNLPSSYTQFRKFVEQGGLKVRKLVASKDKLEPLPSEIDPGEVPNLQALLPNKDAGWATKLGPDFRAKIDLAFDQGKAGRFEGGESAALARWQYWAWDKDMLRTYKETRNGLVGDLYSSQMSPFLSLGLISPRYIYWEIKRYEETFGLKGNENTYWLVFEMLWRDYFKFLALKLGNGLFKLHGPFAYKQRPWLQDPILFKKWALGETGYPFIDAAMNELRLTGFMSNRARQVVASFLTKDMGIDWRLGAEWFESQLLDHDVSANYGNWQYNAGVGVDPREDRYFNIEKQTRVYDPDESFRRLWKSPSLAAPCLDVLGRFASTANFQPEQSPQRKKPLRAQAMSSSRSSGTPSKDIRGYFSAATTPSPIN